MVVTKQVRVSTSGDGDTVDITRQTETAVRESGVRNGAVTLFVVGSTAALTTIEFEPGAVADLGRAFERISPQGADYEHHLRWGDDNGHSHVRAAVLGASLAVPIIEGSLTLGTWQQIVLVDFDTRARNRTIIAQIMGE